MCLPTYIPTNLFIRRDIYVKELADAHVAVAVNQSKTVGHAERLYCQIIVSIGALSRIPRSSGNLS